jgi:shikimate kinase
LNIVLIGYRGTGKSAVADLIARAIGGTPFHVDAEIERRVGRPIAEYVTEQGWDAFRDVESEIVHAAAALDEAVIDTGGGVVIRPANVVLLKANGVLFWLTAEPATIRARIADDAGRPSLTGTQSFLDEIEAVLSERNPLYRAAADYTIRTDERTPDEVAARVVMLFSQRDTGGRW